MVHVNFDKDADGHPLAARMTDDAGNAWLVQIIESNEPHAKGWIVCERAGSSSPRGRLHGNLFLEREGAEREFVRLIRMRAATGLP